MPKVHRTVNTQLDSISVALWDVLTLSGINGGPVEMAFHFFPSVNRKINGKIGQKGFLKIFSFLGIIEPFS